MNKPVSEEKLIQVITGKCSPQERRRIKNWVNKSAENRKRFEKLRQAWEISGELELDQNEDKAWNRLSERIGTPSHLKLHRLNNHPTESRGEGESPEQDNTKLPRFNPGYSGKWQSWVAAACLLVVGVLYLLYRYGDFQEPSHTADISKMKEVVAERGERMYLTLDDGTSIVLNSASVIRYPAHFNGPNREIELEGEAFFSVARNEQKPFLVHTDDAVIRVLGTKFNVNAYSYFNRVEVVVEDGKVSVTTDSLSAKQAVPTPKVVLNQGEYTMVKEGVAPTVPRNVDLDRYLGWINGDLIFEATPLDVVIRRLELYYNRDFMVTDSTLLSRRLTASFKKESFSKVLDVLSVAMDLKYEQSDSIIYLEPYKK